MNKLIFASLLVLSIASYAQEAEAPFGYYNDAILIGRQYSGGTARTYGLGGAQTSLGADLGSTNSNPAGLGLYRKSEYTISPAIGIANSESEFFNKSYGDFKTNFNFSNLGFALSRHKEEFEEGPWRGGTFAVSVNRVADFHGRTSYKGINPYNSYVDFLANNTTANGITEDKSTINDIAYDTYLLDYENFEYFPFLKLGEKVSQSETRLTKGAIYQTDFAYGGNINNKIFIGAALNYQSIRFLEELNYGEKNVTVTNQSEFRSFDLSTTRALNGRGVSGTFGVIIKPNDIFRLGISYKTPSIAFMKEITNNSISSQLFTPFYSYVDKDSINLGSYAASTPENIYKFQNITPGKLNLGGSLFFAKSGFISADIEYTDFSKMKLRDDKTGFTMDADNLAIKRTYNPTLNYKVGGEYRIGVLRARAGFAYYGSPYQDLPEAARVSISLGGGIRTDDYFFDVAFVNSKFGNKFSPYYISENQPVVNVNNTNTSLIFTFGRYF